MEQTPSTSSFIEARRIDARRAGPARLSGAQAVIQALVDVDVDMFFLCSGGALIAPLCEAISAHVGARVVRLSQERAAVHAAEGHAKATGRMAAVLVCGGPGIAAAVPGLMSALADSVPLLCIAGQVSSELIGTDAFRECDALGITRPVTKWNRRIAAVHEAAGIVERAARVARDGRHGPVLVEVPIDVQRDVTPYQRIGHAAGGSHKSGGLPRLPPDRRLAHAASQIHAARRPLLYAGGGLVRSGPHACAALAEFVRFTDIPCALTMTALGALPSGERSLLGWLGTGGSPVANLALLHADLVVCVGARLDERSRPPACANDAPGGPAIPGELVHVDIDPTSINKVCASATPLVGDCAEVLKGVGRCLLQLPGFAAAADAPGRLDDWWAQIAQWRLQCAPDPAARAPIGEQVLGALRDELALRGAVVAVDDGVQQVAAAHQLRHEHPGRWLVSGGAGMPGFALPAAIGALAAQPQRPVVCLSDANALLPTLHELQSVADHGWPLKLVVFPSPVADLRRSTAACGAAPAVMMQRPDVAAIARAFGWRIHRLKSATGIERAVRELLDCDEPYLLQVDPSLADPLRTGTAAEPLPALAHQR